MQSQRRSATLSVSAAIALPDNPYHVPVVVNGRRAIGRVIYDRGQDATVYAWEGQGWTVAIYPCVQVRKAKCGAIPPLAI